MTVVQSETVEPRRLSAGAVLAKLGPFIGLIFVLGLFTALRPSVFATAENMKNILVHATVVITAALGMTMIIISAGIDLSVGANIALCSVMAAAVLNAGMPPVLAAAVGILVGTLCGLFIGTMVTQLKLAPFIVTLGMWGAVRGLAKCLGHFFSEKSDTISPPFRMLDNWMGNMMYPPKSTWMLMPLGVWVMLVLCLVVAATLRYTRFGRHIFAIGSNEQTARLCGVPVDRSKIVIYGLAGALAGVAGIMEFSYIGQGDPSTATGLELDIIAAVVIGGASLSGGQGTVLGTVIGSLLMKTVSNGCTKMGFENYVEQMITGAIIVIACTFDRIRNARE
jgi:ribose/xylose/arabinose/galactoside ABC-type transport system permease subunit